MAAKKAAKKVANRSEKKRKTKTISLRVDDEMRAWLDKQTSGEAYSVVLRRLVREAKEREEKGG